MCLIIGHRGAKSLEKENTIKSIKKAIEIGVDMIEIDVQITSDKELIIVHDSTTHNLTEPPTLLAEMSYHDILKESPTIPKLEEVLDCLSSTGPSLYLDLKIHQVYQKIFIIQLIKTLNKYRHLQSKISLVSFDHPSIYLLKKILPSFKFGLLIDGNLGDDWYQSPHLQPDVFLAINYLYLSHRVITICHHRGIKVFAYTVNVLSEITRLMDEGIDGIITDFPQYLLSKVKNNNINKE